MFSKHQQPPHEASRSAWTVMAASTAIAASAFCLAPGAAAQEFKEQIPGAEMLESGISIQAQVDLVFQQASGEPMRMMQNNFSAGVVGGNATSEYVFDLLNGAAMAGLNQALAQGARTGRVTVVATSCQIGMDGKAIRTVVPLGVFINTTEMDVGEDGKASFRTRIKFIPDIAPARQDKPFKLVPNF
jgi:hypothetical protein